MYSDDIRQKLLVKSLRKSGWAVVNIGEKDFLKKEEYYVGLERNCFILHISLVPDELVVMRYIPYGRRQSQTLKRAIERSKKARKERG
jgi:hypothetical protein